jgi:hypothetical protein
MSLSSPPLAESVQNRLESISMRLDAATDNLLQTRDLLIKHLEHQMLQLQEVRSALHEAAEETNLWAQATPTAAPPATAPLQAAIKPMGQLTLESLFAPLNAVPRNNPPAPAVEVEVVPLVNAEVLFEVEPAGEWEPPTFGRSETVPAAAKVITANSRPAMATTLASAPGEIDPALEKATLDELNEALTRAFAQIANRHAQG